MNTTYDSNVSEIKRDVMNRQYLAITVHGRTIHLFVHGSGNALLLVASERINCTMPANLKGTAAKVQWVQALKQDTLELMIRIRVEKLLKSAEGHRVTADNVQLDAMNLEMEI